MAHHHSFCDHPVVREERLFHLYVRLDSILSMMKRLLIAGKEVVLQVGGRLGGARKGYRTSLQLIWT